MVMRDEERINRRSIAANAWRFKKNRNRNSEGKEEIRFPKMDRRQRLKADGQEDKISKQHETCYKSEVEGYYYMEALSRIDWDDAELKCRVSR